MPKQKRKKTPGTAPSTVGDSGTVEKTVSRTASKSKRKKRKPPKVATILEAEVLETTDEEEATTEEEEEEEDGEAEEEEGEEEEEHVEMVEPEPVVEDEIVDNDLTPSERFGLPEWNVPCSYFFQQQGAMDYESYLRLKDEEKQAGFQYTAARTIQAAWRGFITRYKHKILTLAAIKIQSWIRRFLAQRRVKKIVEEKAEDLRQQDLDAAATKIQAAWRGHKSRKSKLDFDEFKKIQDKNDALKKSIDSINKLEKALTSSDDGARGSAALKKMNDLLREGMTDLDLANLSASRIAELRAYASWDLDGRPSFDMPEPRAPTGWDGKFTSSAAKPRSLYSFSGRSRPGCTDSVDELFPDFPNKEGLIRPDPMKVEALKQAIRLLKKKINIKEERELRKVHHLMRTNRPGVFSDIYCNELTEFEKQVKSVKYWTAPPDPRIKKKWGKSSNAKQEDFVPLYQAEEEAEGVSATWDDNHVEAQGEEGGGGDFEILETNETSTGIRL